MIGVPGDLHPSDVGYARSREGRSRPAVFLDRDGTIIEDAHYLGAPEGVRLLPGAAEAIAALNRAALPVIVVTNQSGIGRGYFGEEEYRAVAARLDTLLNEFGAHVDATYYCPHAPDRRPPCDCRKPRPALFERAATAHGVDLARSSFVGDRVRDVLPGFRAGGTAFLISDPTSREEAVPEGIVSVRSLSEAVETILGVRESE